MGLTFFPLGILNFDMLFDLFFLHANHTTYDVNMHNSFSKIIINLQRDRYIPHKKADVKRVIVVYTRTTQF